MKDRPILFSGPMVRAILEGRKTQTRRVCKPLPGFPDYKPGDSPFPFRKLTWAHCSYGQPGDRLWVRETWRVHGGREYEYQQHQPSVMYRSDLQARSEFEQYEWRPSIFMPRWASRLTLEVTGVRAERLQNITPEDAIAEGVPIDDAVHDYSVLWDRINAKRKGGKYAWKKNPWVWVIEFKKL